jgi:hypothetical protein
MREFKKGEDNDKKIMSKFISIAYSHNRYGPVFYLQRANGVRRDSG